MGFRIPALAVSPYARKTGPETARVNHAQLGHESILKLITYRFGLGNLVTRDAMANNIGESFDWEATDFEPPELPDPSTIVSTPCFLGGDTGTTALPAGAEAHQSDLAELEGLAERHGFEVGDGSIDSIFREPDSVKQAHEEGRQPAETVEPAPPVNLDGGRKRRRRRRRRRRAKRR